MDIAEIKKRKLNLEQEITKLLNDFLIETSCEVIGINFDRVWEYSKGNTIDNTNLDVRIY